ncbi:hypothetical protein PsYK624_124860 [Phanerochaete sordida]|uniref:Uncharacterized protein n=1 Tax=Phanerochaete sordida TaxID=48140 RepID=A0A9P3GIP8_9APHY|nr:hypothetical protein PsYK624_124860 [Phanerochaete sordida]
MSTTTVTASRLAERRTPRPLLLDDFPIPPSHIPTTPLATPISITIPSPGPSSSSNPPLSLPPSSPLPPVPGPSPISDHETLMFISAERSRRLSKMSMASSMSRYSKRDSTATISSLASSSAHLSVAHQPSSPTSSRFGSSASIRSFRSASSHASSSQSHGHRLLEKSPMHEPQIFEEDPADISQISLSDLPPLSSSASTPPRSHRGFSDTEEDEVPVPAEPVARKRSSRGHKMGAGMNDSISSIDMRDLPALQEDEAESIAVPPMASVVLKAAPHLRPGYSAVKPPRPPTAIMNKDLPPLPLNIAPLSSGRTRSDTASTATTSNTHTTSSHAHSVSSRVQARESNPRPGAESPDINQMISRTPRPRRKSSSHLSGSRFKSRPNSTRLSRGSSLHSHSSGKRRDGEIPVPVPAVRRNDSELAYTRRTRDDDEESDYGEVLDGTGTVMDARMLDHDVEMRLERELDGFGSEEDAHLSDGGASDSSIDVQTPLPHLMLREGMLSPHSKLLGKSLRAPTPQDRHLSINSTTGSIMTKSGIIKDERDTTKRRVRHRDGRLLREGLGLTTGLGWSDSEDEDAPSLLTRRVSSMVLSRRTSANSLHSNMGQSSRSSQPLARSVSETQASETIARHRANMRAKDSKSSQPPTAWSASRTSAVSTLSSVPSVRSRASDTSSARSLSSYGRASDVMPSLDYIREHDVESIKDDAGMATPSSVSGSSVAMPLTPVGDDDAGSWTYSTGPSLSAISKMPSRSNLKTPSKTYSAPDSLPFPRERTQSASSNGSAHASVGHHIPPLSAPRQASIPRPLRLPQATGLRPKGSQSSLRQPSSRTPSATPPIPIPQPDRSRSFSATATKRSLPSHPPPPPSRLARSSAMSDPPAPPVPLRPITPADRKPRIGAGMVYRTGSSSSRPSMMRAPSSTTLRSAAAKV